MPRLISHQPREEGSGTGRGGGRETIIHARHRVNDRTRAAPRRSRSAKLCRRNFPLLRSPNHSRAAANNNILSRGESRAAVKAHSRLYETNVSPRRNSTRTLEPLAFESKGQSYGNHERKAWKSPFELRSRLTNVAKFAKFKGATRRATSARCIKGRFSRKTAFFRRRSFPDHPGASIISRRDALRSNFPRCIVRRVNSGSVSARIYDRRPI